MFLHCEKYGVSSIPSSIESRNEKPQSHPGTKQAAPSSSENVSKDKSNCQHTRSKPAELHHIAGRSVQRFSPVVGHDWSNWVPASTNSGEHNPRDQRQPRFRHCMSHPEYAVFEHIELQPSGWR
eukprot:2756114-Rhodomonas_salina.1